MSAEALAQAVVDAISAELAALAAEDSDAITRATAEKAAALAALQAEVAAGARPPRALLEQARDLNAEAILRSRAKLLSVERRLAALRAPTLPAREALVYGRNGRWA